MGFHVCVANVGGPQIHSIVLAVNQKYVNDTIYEAIRMVDALHFHEQHGEVCPAGWNKGQQGMKATSEGVASYLAANAKTL